MRYRLPQATDISKLEAQWHAFFPRRDRNLVAGIWAEVRDKYSEPQRFYHHLGHIVDLFASWDWYYAHLHNPRVVGHDVLYDIGAQDNEERSAVYIGERLERLGEDPATVSRVMEIIRMTAVHACPRDDPDAALMLDLDLAVIGAPQNDYEGDTQAIEAAYSQSYAPEAFWRGCLSRFLDLLLQPARLFKTELVVEALGPRARANLPREKQALLDR